MIDVAKYIRIYKAEFDDDFANKRQAVHKALGEAFVKKNTIGDLLSLANELCTSIPNGKLKGAMVSDLVEKAIKKQSSSFVAEGEDLQVTTCALTAALQYLDNITPGARSNLTTADVLALGLWSGMSFKTVEAMPKLEELRRDIVAAAQKIVSSDSLSSRARYSVPEMKAPTFAEGSTLQQVSESITKNVNLLVQPLRSNSVLDREEIDILWWMLNNASILTGNKFSELNDAQRSVASGCELATLMVRVPSGVHNRMVSSKIQSDTTLTAEQLLVELGEDIVNAISSEFSDHRYVEKYPEIFPLFNLFLTKDASGKANEKPRLLSEWGSRALLEGTTVKISKLLGDGK